MLSFREIIDGIKNGTIKECPHCNGYGSSLHESSERCTICGGSGAVKIARCDCGGTLRHYDGMLGYEAMVCQTCDTHYPLGIKGEEK